MQFIALSNFVESEGQNPGTYPWRYRLWVPLSSQLLTYLLLLSCVFSYPVSIWLLYSVNKFQVGSPDFYLPENYPYLSHCLLSYISWQTSVPPSRVNYLGFWFLQDLLAFTMVVKISDLPFIVFCCMRVSTPSNLQGLLWAVQSRITPGGPYEVQGIEFRLTTCKASNSSTILSL